VDSKLLGAIGLYLRPGTPGEKEAARGKVALLARKAGMTFDEAVSAYQNESETAKASAPDRWEDIFRDDTAMQEVMRKLQAEAQIKKDREARMWADKDRQLQGAKARAERYADEVCELSSQLEAAGEKIENLADELNGALDALAPFVVVADLAADADLETRAESINRHLDLGDRAEASASHHRIRAGQELLEARTLLAHGEWLPWCKANIKRGVRDVQKLLKIASAPNPAAALEAENAQRRESSKAVKYATVAHLETETSPVVEIEAVEVIAAIVETPAPAPRLPRIKNTITVPERVEGETAKQKTERLFLHFASDDLEICNKIVHDLGVQSVESRDSLNRMIDAALDVMAAWDKVRFELRKRWESVDRAAPVEVEPPAPVEAAPVEVVGPPRNRRERRAAMRMAA
jgi:hypothetical protein